MGLQYEIELQACIAAIIETEVPLNINGKHRNLTNKIKGYFLLLYAIAVLRILLDKTYVV